MSNRRQLLNMYPNWLQSLVRAVLLEKYWRKKWGENQWRTYWKDNIQLAKKVSTKEEGNQGA